MLKQQNTQFPAYTADRFTQTPSPTEIDTMVAIAMAETYEESLRLLRELNAGLRVKFTIEPDDRKAYLTIRDPDFFTLIPTGKHAVIDPHSVGICLCFFFYGRPIGAIIKPINKAWDERSIRLGHKKGKQKKVPVIN